MYICEKVAQNVAQPIFLFGKSSPKICASSVIKNYPKYVNYHPIGEYSPNLVTLQPIPKVN
jgi:hypothetical protein